MKIQKSTLLVPLIILVSANYVITSSRTINIAEHEKARILKYAVGFLNEMPETITNYPSSRSAGGKNDFFSEGDYWWPDPNDAGAPYIRKDGVINPDNFTAHRKAMIRMSMIVSTLTAAYVLTNDKKYSESAVKHLLAWFVEEKTKMNPNLLYAQAIHGRITGRGIGIIDTIHLIEVAQAVAVLEKYGVIYNPELNEIKKWFSEYLNWLTSHQYGIDEMNQKNNHGSWWVAQVAAFAKLVGNVEKLNFCSERFKTVLMPTQMASEGNFPLELMRTRPYSYSLFNLEALVLSAQILSNEKNNLWKFISEDGRSLEKGIDFILPFLKDKQSWKYPRDVMYYEQFPVRHSFLLFAGLAFSNKECIDLWMQLESDPINEEAIRSMPIRQPILWINQ